MKNNEEIDTSEKKICLRSGDVKCVCVCVCVCVCADFIILTAGVF